MRQWRPQNLPADDRQATFLDVLKDEEQRRQQNTLPRDRRLDPDAEVFKIGRVAGGEAQDNPIASANPATHREHRYSISRCRPSQRRSLPPQLSNKDGLHTATNSLPNTRSNTMPDVAGTP